MVMRETPHQTPTPPASQRTPHNKRFPHAFRALKRDVYTLRGKTAHPHYAFQTRSRPASLREVHTENSARSDLLHWVLPADQKDQPSTELQPASLRASAPARVSLPGGPREIVHLELLPFLGGRLTASD